MSDASADWPADENIGINLTYVAYIFIVPTVITTLVRIWVRVREKAHGFDDLFILLSALLAIVLAALSIEGVRWGKGRHVHYLSDEEIVRINELSWINQIVLFAMLCTIKTSICILTLRIKDTLAIRIVTSLTIAGLIITNLIPMIALGIECNPVGKYWDRDRDGHCKPPDFRIYSIYVQSAFSILTDASCSIVPVIIVFNLQLNISKKIGICVLMSMGLVCTAFAALRAASLGTDISDTTYDYLMTGVWMTIETNLGIISANLAPLRAVVLRFFPRLLSTTTAPSHVKSSAAPASGQCKDPPPWVEGPYTELNGGVDRDPSVNSDQSEIPLRQMPKGGEKPMSASLGEVSPQGSERLDHVGNAVRM